MNWTQVHLALNHVPVMGVPFVWCLLAWGWARGSREIVKLGLAWTLLLSGVSIGLKFTGDLAAEHASGRLAPVRQYVERHEQSADRATTALFVLGLATGWALWTARGGKGPNRWAVLTVLAVGLLTCGALGWSAHLGGQIGHPELR